MSRSLFYLFGDMTGGFNQNSECNINKVSNSYSVIVNGEWKSIEDGKFV